MVGFTPPTIKGFTHFLKVSESDSVFVNKAQGNTRKVRG